MNEPPRQPSEEELREALKQLRVEDVLLQTVVTLVNLSGRRLTAEGEKNVEQAKLGIDAVRAMLPFCPEEESGPIREALSQLQMIYVQETQQKGAAPPGQPTAEQTGEAPPEQPGPEQQEGEAERAKARSKIWTPPGT